MLVVTEEARKHLADIRTEGDTNSVIRVAVMGSGGTNCGLGLVPDEPREGDLTYTEGEYTLVVDSKLMEFCKEITLDFTLGEPDRCESRSRRGFLINAENPVNF